MTGIQVISKLGPLIVTDYNGDKNEQEEYHGQGTMTFQSGNVYGGDICRGAMHGKGTFVWTDGVVYKGDFTDNQIEGKGEYTWPSFNVYKGHVQEGLRSGKGKFESIALAAEYEGEWKQGQFHGKGRLVQNNDGSVYIGDWVEGKKQGQGTLYYASGTIYKGHWLADKKHGQGEMNWIKKRQVYSGEWENDMPHGYGTCTWESSAGKPHVYPWKNCYQGYWKAGQRHGQGTFYYATGAKYEGEWFENKKHGQGCFISETGRVYKGEFKDDRIVGNFSKFDNECPHVFYIKDLIKKGEPGVDVQLKQLNQVLLRDMTKLYSIYNYLSEKRDVFHSNSSKNTLSQGTLTPIELWLFASKCKLETTCCVTTVQLNRRMADMYKQLPHLAHRLQDPHGVTESFIFHEFLEWVVRIAYCKYHTLPKESLAKNECLAAACLSKFLRDDLVTVDALDTFELQDYSIETQSVQQDPKVYDITKLRNYVKELLASFHRSLGHSVYQVYKQRAIKRQKHALPDSQGDKTMTIRDVLYMMQEFDLLDKSSNGDGLSIANIIHFFAQRVPSVSDGSFYYIEYEMTPFMLFEALFTFAKFLCRPYFDRLFAISSTPPPTAQTENIYSSQSPLGMKSTSRLNLTSKSPSIQKVNGSHAALNSDKPSTTLSQLKLNETTASKSNLMAIKSPEGKSVKTESPKQKSKTTPESSLEKEIATLNVSEPSNVKTSDSINTKSTLPEPSKKASKDGKPESESTKKKGKLSTDEKKEEKKEVALTAIPVVEPVEVPNVLANTTLVGAPISITEQLGSTSLLVPTSELESRLSLAKKEQVMTEDQLKDAIETRMNQFFEEIFTKQKAWEQRRKMEGYN